ncbi:YIP1 family protein [Rhodobacteraceae bacterium HSP-20]|uniref:YIP1 family protein n=1 Tax=Paragemmobacter amnigenus TaxID=2852097 RepID=A0ABS6J4H4_9RHOB|nr:YIP1 family protein [Rhodobacter amnigenus]MBU9698387.1 YIP1 family protein [Rhodobacter amnigenus]MBV4389614.1 YIP1 family protein [Rhodobacter amnigenus]
MQLTVGNLAGLVRLTLGDPRLAARAVMAQPLPVQARWGALILTAVLSAFLMQAVTALLPPLPGPDGEAVTPIGPAIWAGMVASGMVMTVLLVHHVGRWRGGSGQLGDAVLLVAWLQFIQLLTVLLQIVVMLVLPFAAPLVEIGGVLLFLWLLVHFVAELHGFRSIGLVFLGVVVTFVAAVFTLSALLLMLGVGL